MNPHSPDIRVSFYFFYTRGEQNFTYLTKFENPYFPNNYLTCPLWWMLCLRSLAQDITQNCCDRFFLIVWSISLYIENDSEPHPNNHKIEKQRLTTRKIKNFVYEQVVPDKSNFWIVEHQGYLFLLSLWIMKYWTDLTTKYLYLNWILHDTPN